jgi:hypothetical protein
MNNMNLNVKGAIEVAMDYVQSFNELFQAKGMRLEETVLSDNGRWLITLSFIDSDTFDSRVYKVLEIDPESREVKAMKIRDTATQLF